MIIGSFLYAFLPPFIMVNEIIDGKELDAKLEYIISKMLPLVDLGIPQEKMDKFIQQRPYELSSSPDHIDY